MVSINTNISSIVAQRNMTASTNRLNQAIERLSTGYKINHASDNAANYSISNNMNVQLSSYDIAADNIAMGMDLLSTAQDTIAGMQERGSRIHALITQARNGTYGADSLSALTTEAQALVSEINRLYINTEYNGRKLLEIQLPEWAETVKANAGVNAGLTNDLTPTHNGFIAEIYTDTPDVIVTDPNQLATAISTKSKIGIGNAETLAKLAELVNSGTTCEGKTIILTEDVDLSAICAANTDAEGNGGWTPIGKELKPFCGHFNGNGHKVTGLYIQRKETEYQGLFGYTSGLIDYIGVEGAYVKGRNYTGVLAGRASEIWNCYATGFVRGYNPTGGLVGEASIISTSYAMVTVEGVGSNTGGLAGKTDHVRDCYATGKVFGQIDNTGGLVGYAENFIINCYATGSVRGRGYNTGGLVGKIDYDITNCYATGDVTGQDECTGGLVGEARGAITNCYAMGNVTGQRDVTGGLVGEAGWLIMNSYATGNVSGSYTVTGGLAGCACEIRNCYATGNVSGGWDVCGLVGDPYDEITNSYATGKVTENNVTRNNDIYYNSGGIQHTFEPIVTSLQVGINSNSDSKITVDTTLKFNLNVSNLTSDSVYNSITSFLNQLSQKSTELGAAQNRLESALESTLVQMDNLTSSLSTIRDADISKVSSDYIRQQILQQAAATLMSTANQSPAIALQLI